MHKSGRAKKAASARAAPRPNEITNASKMTSASSERFEALVSHEARMFKAGNSLAIRVPRGIVKHMDLDDGMAVTMAVDGDVLCIRKATSEALSALIDRITPENTHPLILAESAGPEWW